VHGATLAARELTVRYAELVGWAFTEYVALVAEVAIRSDTRIPWSKVEANGFEFVKQFVSGTYRHPWTGDFLVSGQQWIGGEVAFAEYRLLHENAPWFALSPFD